MVQKGNRLVEAAAVFALLVVFFLQGYSIASRKSNVFDEPAHILAGYAYVTEGMDFLAPLHHPVVARSLAALFPATLLDLDFDRFVQPEEDLQSNFDRYSLKFLYENKVDGRTILFYARMGNIMLGAFLGFFVYLWARELWGAVGGLLSLAFYALSPEVLAHSSLATTDLPITAFFFLTAYLMYRVFSSGPGIVLAAASGVALGLALATKHTALLLAPTIAAAYVGAVMSGRAGLLRSIRSLGLTLAVAYAAVWAIYGFRYHSIDPLYHGLHWETFAGTGLEPLFDALRAIKFLPESYLYGIAGVLSSGGGGKVAFLMGEYSLTGWWYYYTVAFLIKTPIAALVLMALALACAAVRREQATLVKVGFVLLPAVVVFVVVSSQKVNIGIRHVLPALPFLFLVVGAFFASTLTRWKAAVSALCVAWHIYAAASIHPHQLAYFNEFVGGPGNGYKYLVESNVDWGQDLAGLKEYMDENKIEGIKLSYFGLSNPAYYGIDSIYMPSFLVLGEKNREAVTPAGYFAISATMLQGVYMPDRDYYRDFREAEPVANIGYSIFIYKPEDWPRSR
jgi:hypothetical protein